MGAKTLGFAAAVALLAGIGVLVWWIIDAQENDSNIIELEPGSFGNFNSKAFLTRIPNVGEVFWWFFPTTKALSTAQPLILWIDGILGQPPSSFANFGMFGPVDYNLNERPNSWINSYNLLFIDPLGSGYSQASNVNNLPKTPEEASEYILAAVESFYTSYEEYKNAPLFIFGQGYGAQIGLHLCEELLDNDIQFGHNLRGIVINNGIISPAAALTKLGFYLEELGYVDDKGRDSIESLSEDVNNQVKLGLLEQAFDSFISLENYINENAGAISLNLGHIITKETHQTTRGYFGQDEYRRKMLGNINVAEFMGDVANQIGMTNVVYNGQSEAALQSLKQKFMKPATEILEDILEETDLSVHIINGNLDAVSNTPGQLEWINTLDWQGKLTFLNRPRETLVVNRLVEGYFKRSKKFSFYWMNGAGQSVALDSPLAMRRVVELIMENDLSL